MSNFVFTLSASILSLLNINLFNSNCYNLYNINCLFLVQTRETRTTPRSAVTVHPTSSTLTVWRSSSRTTTTSTRATTSSAWTSYVPSPQCAPAVGQVSSYKSRVYASHVLMCYLRSTKGWTCALSFIFETVKVLKRKTIFASI